MRPSLKTDNFQKLEEAVTLANEIDDDDLDSWLSVYCEEDEGLRVEIESLLRVRKESETFLESSAANYAVHVVADENDFSSIGKTFGVYTIIRALGRGGMGTVYLAERCDGAFDRQVALKVIARTLVDPELETAFRRERQILAGLDHPNIAKLLDGGVSENGEPFLVMDFVNGLDLVSYVRSRELCLKDRLYVFLDVCKAVSYAHRNLVVHRDIKPSNILVTSDGNPKLLDFGLAKVMNQSRADEVTQSQFRAATPAYASPEQLEGGAISTTSDVFSLGKVLEKLVAPDTTGDTQKIGLDNDLANIMGMSTRAEPSDRYPSVDSFAEDLTNYLEFRPIRARPPSVRYRASKFVRRHKFAVISATTAILAIITGLVVAVWQAKVAREQFSLAQEEKYKAERTSQYLAAALQFSDPSAAIPGAQNRRDATINQLLDDFAPRVEAEFSDQPEILASLQRTIGMAYTAQTRLPEAERYLSNALKLDSQLYGEDSQPSAADYTALASIEEAKGNLEQATNLLNRAISIYREQPPSDDVNREVFAAALNVLGDVKWTNGDFTSCESLYNESLVIASQLTRDRPDLVAAAKRGLGITRYAQGRLEEASELLSAAISEYRKAPNLLWKLPDALNFLAQTLIWKNEYGSDGELYKALSYLEESKKISQDVWGENNFWYPRSLWLQVYAMCFINENECRAAEPMLNKSQEINDRIYPDNKITRANIYDARSVMLTGSQRPSDGEKFARDAVELYRSSMSRGAPSITLARIHLSDSLSAQGKYIEAETVLQEAFKDASEAQGVDHWRTKEVENRLNDLRNIVTNGR